MRLRANVEENNPSLACCPVQNITNKDSSSHSFSALAFLNQLVENIIYFLFFC